MKAKAKKVKAKAKVKKWRKPPRFGGPDMFCGLVMIPWIKEHCRHD